MADEDLSVAVVGGGPCGLLTALLLGRFGIPCHLFEKHPGISQHPKAMGVTRRSAEIFAQLGLDQGMQTADLPDSVDKITIWSQSLVGGKIWGEVPLAERFSPHTPMHPFHSPQTHTEEVLLQAVQKEPLVHLNFSTEVLESQTSNNGVQLRVKDRESGNERTIQANYLVAADGAGSQTRHQLAIDTDGPGDMGHFINTYFRASYGNHLSERRSVLYNLLSEEYFEAFVAVNGHDLWLMHHFLQPGETVEDYPADRLRETIQYVSGLPEEPVEILGISPWVMSPKVAREFRRGRIFLTGDAAARLSPAGGLGLNTGLQSAHNLAWKLAWVLQGKADPALLDSYQEERRQAALFTMENSGGNATEIFEIIQHGLGGDWDGVRERVAHSRRGGAGLGQDLGLEYAHGALIEDGSPSLDRSDPVNDYQPQGRPGCRAPHLAIRADPANVHSTLDYFGRNFVLLCTAEGGERYIKTAQSAGWDCVIEGRDFAADEMFAHHYGLQPGGAVLVRPDGYVAWRDIDGSIDPDQLLSQASRNLHLRVPIQ